MGREFSKKFYQSKEWRKVREYVLMRDNYLCCDCGHPATEVHHIIHLTPENIWDVNISLNDANLVSLCRECHFERHRGEHAKGREMNESYPYCFDENGLLIPKQKDGI